MSRQEHVETTVHVPVAPATAEARCRALLVEQGVESRHPHCTVEASRRVGELELRLVVELRERGSGTVATVTGAAIPLSDPGRRFEARPAPAPELLRELGADVDALCAGIRAVGAQPPGLRDALRLPVRRTSCRVRLRAPRYEVLGVVVEQLAERLPVYELTEAAGRIFALDRKDRLGAAVRVLPDGAGGTTVGLTVMGARAPAVLDELAARLESLSEP